MTTLNDVAKKKAAEQSAEQKAAVELVRLAREQGLSLTGPEGLLKQLLTDTTGAVELDMPRDRAAIFEPQIVKKRQRWLSGVDEVELSSYAKGLTTGEISAQFAEIYGASVFEETISRITDKVTEEMNDWSVRPLDERRIPLIIANW